MARFGARMPEFWLHSINPNIAAIYGLEESHGVRALVLALIDGPTLADRIANRSNSIGRAIHIGPSNRRSDRDTHTTGASFTET